MPKLFYIKKKFFIAKIYSIYSIANIKKQLKI